MKKHNYFVYIVTNFHCSVIYVGVTNNLTRRIYEHEHSLIEGFTRKYNCKHLVFYQHFPDIVLAIAREKQIKKWNRRKKNELFQVLTLNGNS